MSLTETPGGSGRQTQRDLRHVQMWWKASEGAEPLEIDFPDGWCIRRIGLNAPPPMSDEEIAAAIRHPVAGPPLAERVRGCKDVCIAISVNGEDEIIVEDNCNLSIRVINPSELVQIDSTIKIDNELTIPKDREET